MKDQSTPFVQFLKRHWLWIAVVIFVLWVLNKNGELTFSSRDMDESMMYGKGAAIFEEYAPAPDSMGMDAMRAENSMMYPETGGGEAQKVMRTASLSLHVEDVRESAEEIGNRVNEWGGAVLNTNISRGEDMYYGWISLRVPVDRFDAAMQSLREMALIVNSEYSDASDVTETYTDLEVRLKNLQAEEEQYLTILDRAVTVEEVLQVTQALSNVRYQIESIQTQLSYYDNRVDYSTIDVNLTEDSSVSAVTNTWRPLGTLKQAFSDWVVWLQDVADKVIQGLVFGWPLLLILILALIFRKRK